MASSSSAALPIILQASSSTSSPLTTVSSLHLLPLHIAYSGHAKIDAYFDPQPAVNDADHLQAYFRGRRLMGTQLSLPKGYTGQLWKSNAPAPAPDFTRVSSLSSSTALRSIKRDHQTTETTPIYTHESPRRSPRKSALAEAHQSSMSTSTSHRPPAKKMRLADKVAAAKARKATLLSHAAVQGITDAPPSLNNAREAKPLKFSMDPSPSPEPEAESKLQHTAPDSDPKLEFIASKAEPKDKTVEVEYTAAEFPLEVEMQKSVVASPMPSPTCLPRDQPSTPPPAIPTASHSAELLSAPTFDADYGDAEPNLPHLSLQRDMIPIGSWRTLTLWNPDTLPDLGDDPYAKSITEWTELANLIHSA